MPWACRASPWPSAPTSRPWRTQGAGAVATVDGSLPGAATIIHHPDVRRMLMTMRALTEGCRAMAITAAAAATRRTRIPMRRCAGATQALYEFLVPLVKGYSTEMSLEVA